MIFFFVFCFFFVFFVFLFLFVFFFFSNSSHFFPNFGYFFHLNPSIFGIINTGFGRTSDFSSRFARNLARSDGISPDLGWIWQDLAGSSEISSRFESVTVAG